MHGVNHESPRGLRWQPGATVLGLSSRLPMRQHFALLVRWATWYSLLGGTQDAFYIKEQSVDHMEALR